MTRDFMSERTQPWLECLACQARFAVAPLFSGCPACQEAGRKSPLEVRYDYARLGGLEPDSSKPGIWRWHPLLPPVEPHNRVSLGEGNTPLVQLHGWSGSTRLYLKNETANPTWAYKDRANCVSASLARQFGLKNIATVSTGNHGNSLSAYAAAGGLRCVVFCHADAPELQLALMQFYGARVFRGGRREAMLEKLAARGDWFPACTSSLRDNFANPFAIEGFKTIAFEIFEQLDGRVPDRVFVPVGSGDGFYGIWKGFVELERLGVTDKRPRMVACQSTGADCYVRAWRRRAEHLTPLAHARTVALSICEEIGGEQALGAIYESAGAAIGILDEAILEAASQLARQGFALEPASAAAVAGARSMAAGESALGVEAGACWVAIGTGAAVKWPQNILARPVAATKGDDTATSGARPARTRCLKIFASKTNFYGFALQTARACPTGCPPSSRISTSCFRWSRQSRACWRSIGRPGCRLLALSRCSCRGIIPTLAVELRAYPKTARDCPHFAPSAERNGDRPSLRGGFPIGS